MKVKEWICRTEEHNFLWINIYTNTDFTKQGLFYPLSFCLVYLSRMMQNKPKTKQATWLLYMQLFQVISH